MELSLLDQARALPAKQRAHLIEELWESLLDEGYEPELTAEQAAELDHRQQAHRADPDAAIPWERCSRA